MKSLSRNVYTVKGVMSIIINIDIYLLVKDVYQFNHWDEVCVDMIGPWKITINNFKYAFRAITCIYSVIALPEVIHVDNTTANIVAQAFEASWLS